MDEGIRPPRCRRLGVRAALVTGCLNCFQILVLCASQRIGRRLEWVKIFGRYNSSALLHSEDVAAESVVIVFEGVCSRVCMHCGVTGYQVWIC